MSRDGSSGGVIRLAVITKEGVDRLFVDGNDLPGKHRDACICDIHLTIFFLVALQSTGKANLL